MKAKGILIILILILIIIVVVMPLWEDLPVIRGGKFPDIAGGVESIGEQLTKIVEGITRSFQF